VTARSACRLLACLLAMGSGPAWPASAPRDMTGFGLSGGAADSLRSLLNTTPAETADSWLSPAAAQDSLDAFWQGLDRAWLDPVSPELKDFGLDGAAIDSLSRIGDRAVTNLVTGRVFRFTFRPLDRLAFSRVEGLRPGFVVRVQRVGLLPPELEVGLGYGLASERIVGDATLKIPLIISQPTRPSGLPSGSSWPLLSLDASGGRLIRRFAGDDRGIRGLTACIYGADPNHFYRSEGGQVVLQLLPRRWLGLQAGILRENHVPLPVATTWNLLADRRDVTDNLPVESLQTRALRAGLGVQRGRWRLWSDLEWHRVFGGELLLRLAPQVEPPAPAEKLKRADFRRLRLGLDGSVIDRHGNEYLLKARWVALDRQAPLQWKTYLGDYGTLRGFDAREIAGDQAGWGSLDIRWGFDLWRALRVPLLGRLGLQPITFADYGRALARDGPLGVPAVFDGRPWRDGWRADAGFGFGKLIGVPGRQGHLRLYVARPVGEGMDDRPWRVVVGFEN
jgi:hypothetical protein